MPEIFLLIRCIFLIHFLFGFPMAFAQDAYKWKDSQGRTIYGSKPPKSTSNFESFKTRGISTYSENKVLKGLGITSQENKIKSSPSEWEVKKEDKIRNKETPGKKLSNVSEVMLKSLTPVVTLDENKLITSCVVEIVNETDKEVFEISVAFEFPDGTLIPAVGPFELAPRAKSDFKIPPELLPLDKKLGDHLGDLSEEESAGRQALPKVIVHSLGGN